MKICKQCGTQFPDNVNFCSKCGGSLIPHGDIYCSKCGTKNTTMDSFCRNCGAPLAVEVHNLAEAPYPNIPDEKKDEAYPEMPEASDHNNKNHKLIIAAAILAIILIAIIAVKLSSSSSKTPLPDKTGTESQAGTETQDFSEYQSYYDTIDDSFSGMILSSSMKGELKTYKKSLEAALKDKNLESCKYNYDQLNDLYNSTESSSKDTLNSLKKKMQKYEKKSKCSKAKKSTEYKKNKKLAQTATNKGDYLNAKTYYESCLDTLKKANKKKTSHSAATNDNWYETGASDSDTYDAVYNYYLEPDSVAGFSGEKRRYYMNTLFAAYGYRFNNRTIQNFFDNQTWYSPDYSIAAGDQSAIRAMFDDVCSYNYSLLSNR